MIVPGPSTFSHSRNVHRVNPEYLLLPLAVLPPVRLGYPFLEGSSVVLVVVDRQLLDLLYHELFLSADYFAYFGVVYSGMHVALHHSTTLVVLYVSLPSLSGHSRVFTEPLLAEVT